MKSGIKTYYTITVSGSTNLNMACLLNKNEGSIPSNSNQTPTKKRKKRSDSSVSKPKFGCPDGFEKVNEYLCLDVDNKRTRTLTESRQYCQNKYNGATLLYFLNPHEAHTVWKWLGSNF